MSQLTKQQALTVENVHRTILDVQRQFPDWDDGTAIYWAVERKWITQTEADLWLTQPA